MLSKDAGYIWARPALLARKFRSVELRDGFPTSHARRGTAFNYNIPAKRAEERSRIEKAEAAYCSSDFPMANQAVKAEGEDGVRGELAYVDGHWTQARLPTSSMPTTEDAVATREGHRGPPRGSPLAVEVT
ncbi:hypothetical protein LRP31_33720 (plasmid) [Mesorhizobium mediterraneum]|uniref:Uncharacterized protein n=1 Tax=Mesorhizobium mediterraneum TaxID=43617 RepID=A0AB36QYK0_9HYPH|nr:hypothetical protein [Mesorhizobium mediterraneum]PAP97584.1 hypothetical protein CIT25_35380 [Mesorhizobium mediterraneum]RWN26245.1 MAG: hypothetical protein EOR96_34335 [Mesorhizobium sp.]WIW57076.1 hypothetical protein LRP31_33720 [Mesorhizobium mediterraneum]